MFSDHNRIKLGINNRKLGLPWKWRKKLQRKNDETY